MARFLCWFAILAGLLRPVDSQAIGFHGHLSPSFWQEQEDLGTVYFTPGGTNGFSQLHIEGPDNLPTSETSADGIDYIGFGSGLTVPGTLTFDWYFNAGDALNAQADFWSTPGGSTTLASGGPGASSFGTFSVDLDTGDFFSFLLTTLNPRGDKVPATLLITNAQFTPNIVYVPDTSSSLPLLVLSIGCLLAFAAYAGRQKVRMKPARVSRRALLKGKALFFLLALGGVAKSLAANPDGALRTEAIAAYNFVVDSNVESPSTYAPRAAYLGAKFYNDGTTPLTNVFAYIGDFTNNTPGVYPRRTHMSLTGFSPDGKFALTHEGGSSGTADATRYIGTIMPGQSKTVYWLVSYPNLDAAGNAVHGPSVKPDDDLWLQFDIWAKGTQSGIQRTSLVNRTVTMRNEISAMANKIFPNGANKVPNEYLDLLGIYEPRWTNTQVSVVTPGATTALQGFWYDLGVVGFGFDNTGDLVPDHNAWMQPVGDPSLFDPSAFRLVRTYAMVIVKLKTGGEQIITVNDDLYFENVPENNGAVGFVGYEFMAMNGPSVARFTPYQEVASGYDNEKFNGDYGASLPPLYSTPPTATIVKDANVASVSPGGTIQYTMTYTNTGTVPIGEPDLGVPLVVQDAIPAGTKYVAGTAAAANVLPAGVTNYTILYSTNNGTSWLTSEPAAATNVTHIQWWLSNALQTNAGGTVRFNVTVNNPYTNSPIITNVVGLAFGNNTPFATDDAKTILLGNNAMSGTVYADTGTGGGVFGNALKESGETGISNVLVSLYYDANTNSAFDSSDVFLMSTNSATNGFYIFTNLYDGRYLSVVTQSDPDIPYGYTITTVSVRAANLDSPMTNSSPVISTNNDFGFAPALTLDKAFIGSTNVYEGYYVTNTVTIFNNLPGNGTAVASPASYTFWATNATTHNQANRQWTNISGAIGAPDGNPAGSPFANVGEELRTTGFYYPTQSGNITNVELVIVARTNSAFGGSSIQIDSYSNYSGGLLFSTNATVTTLFTNSSFVYYYYKVAGALSWTNFNGLTMSNLFTSSKSGQESGVLLADAVGFRITTDQLVGGSTTNTVLNPVPLVDRYDSDLLRFVSASITPDTTNTSGSSPNGVGTLTWTNVGPIYPGGSNTITLRFLVLEPANNTALNANVNTALVYTATFGNGYPANTATDYVAMALSPSGSIGDYVWRDLDSNGVQNVGEPGISGASVVLSNTTSGVNITNVTDAYGYYLFSGITNAANYVVRVLTNTLPFGFVQTYDKDGLGSPHQTTVTGFNPAATDGTDDILDVDFGYRFTVALIDGYVWNDINRSGTTNADSGEPYLSNIRVILYTNSTPIATNLTDSSGYYRFTNLLGGTYQVVVTNTSGALTNSGWTQSFDTDGVPSTTNRVTVVLASGGSGRADYSYYQGGALAVGDTLFYDWDGDAVQDVYDEGIPNITVKLYYDANTNGVIEPATDLLIMTTSTTTNGTYIFTNLATNAYIVVVDEADPQFPLSVYQTKDPDSTLDGMSAVTLTATNLLQDFGYQPYGTGTIGDFVWFDMDADGLQDGGGEIGLTNITVVLYADFDTNGTYVAIATNSTGTGGLYTFSNLPAGNYRVIVDTNDADLPNDAFGNNYVPTTPTTKTITLASGESNLTADFGFTKLGAIGDTIFWDANGNGTQDWNENGVTNVTVQLYYDVNTNRVYDGGDVLYGSDTTDTNGVYIFTGLSSTNYVVVVVTNTGVLTNATLTADPNADGEPCNGTCDGQYGLNLGIGVSFMGADFGYQPPGIIGDTLWLDTDADGVVDTNEFGIPYVSIELRTSVGNNLVATTETDADGLYLFSNLTNGTYKVIVLTNDADFPASVVQTYDADGLGSAHQSTVTISGGGINLLQDFGYRYSGANLLSGTIGLDGTPQNGVMGTNGSGYSSDEAPFDGVPVYLYRWVDTGNNTIEGSETDLIATTTTAANGDYSFTSLPSGGQSNYYIVSISAPTENLLMTTVLGSTTALQLLNSTNASGETISAYQVVTNQAVTTNIDFAFISSVAYDFGDLPDVYATTLQSDGARHIASTNLYLGASVDTESNGSPNSTATGDGADENGVTTSGIWTNGVNGGTVSVTVGAGSGWLVGWIDFDQDGSFADTDDMIVSRFISVTNGTTNLTFEIPSGSISALTNTALYARFRLFEEEPLIPALSYTGESEDGEVEDYLFNLGAIGDYVWNDRDGDGVQDPTEPPIAGVRVFIDLNADNQYQSNEPSSVTTSSGAWNIGGLNAGNYSVIVDTNTVPTGLTVTGDPDGTIDGRTSVTLSSGQVRHDLDFGYQGNSAFGDYVWNDSNADGLQAGETGMDGVRVYVDLNNDNTFQSTEPAAITAGGGAYFIGGMQAGSYTVRVDTNTLPYGFAPTYDLNGIGTPNVTALTLGTAQTNLLVDWGYILPANLGNQVFHDLNNNGIKDGGDTGIDGVVVELLFDANVNGLIQDGETNAIGTNITSGGGFYNFTNLAVGNYQVRIAATNFTSSMPLYVTNLSSQVTVTTDDSRDNDDNGTQDGGTNTVTLSPIIALVSGETDNTKDFGFTALATVYGHLYYDVNGNGTQNGGEPNLTNVTVTVTVGTNVITAVSDANGNWSTLVPPGSVSADVLNSDPDFTAQIPPGYTQTEGTDPTVVSVSSGQNVNAGNDGYYSPATVYGHVYFDTNGNGTQNVGEPNITNVTVNVTNSLGVVVPATTDANGNWSAEVPPGSTTAKVLVTDPDFLAQVPVGYTQTEGTDPTTVTAVAGTSTDAGNDGYWDNVPTLALLASIRGYVEDGAAVVEWTTASEVGTLGFDLFRQTGGGWVQVNSELVVALNSLSGGTYEVRDADAAVPGTHVYKLVEWEQDGDEIVVGTYTLSFEAPLRLTMTREGNQMRLQWQGGKAPYSLEKRTTLDGGSALLPGNGWIEVPLSDPEATSIVIPADEANALFRVRSAP